MPRTTDKEFFLKTLSQLSSNGTKFVSNESLRLKLKWDLPKYKKMHAALRKEDLIIVKRGRGGLVSLASHEPVDKLKVFVSYSHLDSEIKVKLIQHLQPIIHEGLIEVWADHKILAGDKWDKEITEKLAESDIILALVSINFINSKYCYDIELESALEREIAGEVKIIPVIIGSCLWHTSPLGRLKALPEDGKAVPTFTNLDEALMLVATGVRQAAIALLEDA